MLLSIDTSAGTGVAIVDRELGVLAELIEEDTRSHAEVIGVLIVRSLERSGVAIPSLSGVAVGMGPGPFTGLRVGIAAAAAFAFGAGIPLVRVVSHDAVAFGHYADGNDGPLLVVTDARRREIYFTAYSGADAARLPVRAQGPGLCRPADIRHVVEGYARYERLDAEQVAAASVGLLAEGLYLHQREFAAAEPLYLRAPDVTVPGAPKRVS